MNRLIACVCCGPETQRTRWRVKLAMQFGLLSISSAPKCRRSDAFFNSAPSQHRLVIYVVYTHMQFLHILSSCERNGIIIIIPPSFSSKLPYCRDFKLWMNEGERRRNNKPRSDWLASSALIYFISFIFMQFVAVIAPSSAFVIMHITCVDFVVWSSRTSNKCRHNTHTHTWGSRTFVYHFSTTIGETEICIERIWATLICARRRRLIFCLTLWQSAAQRNEIITRHTSSSTWCILSDLIFISFSLSCSRRFIVCAKCAWFSFI